MPLNKETKPYNIQSKYQFMMNCILMIDEMFSHFHIKSGCVPVA